MFSFETIKNIWIIKAAQTQNGEYVNPCFKKVKFYFIFILFYWKNDDLNVSIVVQNKPLFDEKY